MMLDERLTKIALALCPSVEPSTLRRLMDKLGSALAVWTSAPEKWQNVCRIHPETVSRLDAWRRAFRETNVEEKLEARGIQCLVKGDDMYTQSLLDLHDPPEVLFVRGNMTCLESKRIAIVGTRRASGYGLEATKWISETLAHAKCTVVSGLAVGIDGQAHTSAIQAKGDTIGILGCGVDVCYPPSHHALYQDILSNGCLMSEYAPGTMVTKYRFPERNRLIAALAEIIIVVQAGEKSGAICTVDSGLSIGREIYVVPGPITSVHFQGSHRLIQQGATILLNPHDLLMELGMNDLSIVSQEKPHVPVRWRNLYHTLEGIQSASAMAMQLQLPIGHVYAGLLELELSGLVLRVQGGLYQRVFTADDDMTWM